jgi:hypothetical protein
MCLYHPVLVGYHFLSPNWLFKQFFKKYGEGDHNMYPIDETTYRTILGKSQQPGQNELAPTNALVWMDGAFMGAHFSSLPILGLTKVVNSS